MSHRTRLNKLEQHGEADRLWALIGIGKPANLEHQKWLEREARNAFYASGGDRCAYLAFMPFADFDSGFICYVKRSDLISRIMSSKQ